MKKFIQLLALAVLMMFMGAAYGGVWIVNPDDGDTVNKNSFTIVAKAEGFADGDNLQLYVLVSNEWTGDVITAFVDHLGVSTYQHGSETIEVVKPDPKDMIVNSPHGKFPIVVHVGGYQEGGHQLTIQVVIENMNTGEVVVETITVRTK